MNIGELYTTLKRMGVPEAWYSLDGSLLPDRTILYRNHNIWDVFYFDERGGINNINHFSNEEDACIYILNLLSREFNNSKLNKDINTKQSDTISGDIIYL